MTDVRDILELENPRSGEVSKEVIMGIKRDTPNSQKRKAYPKKPEGMT